MKLRPGHHIDGLDGPLGTLDALVLGPDPTRLTHLLVSLDDEAGTERLITADRLAVFEDEPRLLVHADGSTGSPAGVPPNGDAPNGEAPNGHGWAIRQDAEVHDAAGTRLGRVNEFYLDPRTAIVTHLIVHEVHHLQHQELRIPLAAIVDVAGDVIRLDLRRQQLAARGRAAPAGVKTPRP